MLDFSLLGLFSTASISAGLPSSTGHTWSPPSRTGADFHSENASKQCTKRGLCHRLSSHLRTTHSRESPLQYVQQIMQHWYQRHFSAPGNHSICGGNFNACWQGRLDGFGYTKPLQQWVESIGYKSRHNVSPENLHYITRPSTNLLECTETVPDFASLNMKREGCMGLWLSMSNHRPVLAATSGLPVSRSPLALG